MVNAALLLALVSCSSAPLGPADLIEITDIEVSPSSLSVTGGELADFAVTVFGKDGAPISNAPITFTSSDPTVAVVDGDGTVWAFRTGEVLVTAKPGRGSQDKMPPGQEKRSATVTVPDLVQERPGRVSDLQVDTTYSGGVVLSFTEVDDGTGESADYLVRFQIAPFAWQDAADVLYGSCSTPVLGQVVENRRSCTVTGLKGGTRYGFQLVAFRGSLNSEVTYGDLSNEVSATIPEAESGAPWLDFDFEKYGSTEELRAAKSDFMGGSEDLGRERIFLDTGAGYSAGNLRQSMRYDWVDQGTQSISIGRGIQLPEEVREVWVELVLRWSPNFTSCNPADPPCDHKTFFLMVWPDMNYRWSVHIGGGAGETGPETAITIFSPKGHVEGRDELKWSLETMPYPRPYVHANPYYDGKWHVVRLHAKHSTNASTYDGRMRLWIDGEIIYDTKDLEENHESPRFSTNDDTRIRAILIGRNKDKGLDSGTESMWVSRVRAWRDDPGW